jgi:hypothetical protein
LGTLALSPNIELIDGYDEETGIFGIPYLDDFNEFNTRLLYGVTEKNKIPRLIVTHASIFPPGDHPPYDHMNADQIMTRDIPLAYGHIHDPHGFYQVKKSWFCNNGAISRGSLHEETLKREPAVTLFDSEATGCPFTSIPVPFKPAEQVFRLAEHVEAKQAESRLDDFLSSVEGVNLTSLSLESVIDTAKATNLSPEAKQELEDILQSVSS